LTFLGIVRAFSILVPFPLFTLKQIHFIRNLEYKINKITTLIDKNKIKKILIIKLRGIGDVILSTVVLKNLKDQFPSAEIDYLTEKPGKDALSNIPEINNILLLDRKSTFQKIRQLSEIRRRKYDLVFDFFTNPTTAQITFFSGAKYRVGFPYRGRKYAYNLFGPADRNKYHSADLHLKTLENIGISADKKDLLFSLSTEEIAFSEKFISENNLENKVLVGLCPSGGWQSKKCSPEKFAEFANLINQHYNVEFLILWGPGDYDDAVGIKKSVNFNAIISPSTKIKQMASLISKCTVLIANDSGPMHISAALGTPTIALFGPTNPFLQGPYGSKHETVRLDELECINCDLTECPKHQECFSEMPTQLVLNKFEQIVCKNKIQIDKRNG
jgi:heptosyltransferase III